VRADDLFTIDVAAEVATLCGAQLQGPWQVPAELVRLANARGAARVEINRARSGLRFRCDGVLASREELQDLVEIFDLTSGQTQRQDAINRIEAAGLSALLWATGLPGARLTLFVRTGGWSGRLVVRGGRIELEVNETETGPPSTTLTWRCRGLGIRRAVAWLRFALRFVPIPVIVCGRQVERGFQDGLYRMRIAEGLPGEIAVTASGDAPRLWLLEHGVLSARAVIPGYPAFSAAIEMSGEVPVGSSADVLRAAANPHLDRLIDESVRMLLLLVDRLSSVKEPVRERLATLLLGFAVLGIRREQVLVSPIVSVREGTRRRMESPSTLARRAVRRGGVIAAVEPGSGDSWAFEGLVVEAATEERSLLAELLNIRIENVGGGSRSLELVPRIVEGLRRGWRATGCLWAPRALCRRQLTPEELRLVEAASIAGVELVLCEGAGMVRRCRSGYLVGRDRPEVQAAALVLASGGEWLYPALLAVAGEDLDIPDEIRNHWLEAVTPDNYEF